MIKRFKKDYGYFTKKTTELKRLFFYERGEKMKRMTGIFVLALILALVVGGAAAQTDADDSAQASNSGVIAIAAALAIGFAAIGSAYGIAHAGSAALAAMTEKPEIATWGIIIVALAEGLALYGLVIAFMIVGKM